MRRELPRDMAEENGGMQSFWEMHADCFNEATHANNSCKIQEKLIVQGDTRTEGGVPSEFYGGCI